MFELDLATKTTASRGAATAAADRKRWGQLFTGPEVAGFVANLLELDERGGALRVLDPGVGVGILRLTAARPLLSSTTRPVHIVGAEPESGAREGLQRSLGVASESSEGHRTFEITRRCLPRCGPGAARLADSMTPVLLLRNDAGGPA